MKALVLTGLTVWLAGSAFGQNVGWRGDGSGRYPGAEPPTEWGGNKDLRILWTAKVGEAKYGSPVAVGNRIFVLAEPAKLLCLDAATGEKLWEKTNGFGDLDPKQEDKPVGGDVGNTTPAPVTDGTSVYAIFGSGIVTCCDLKGERKWIRRLDTPCATEHGRCASPALAGDKLIVTAGCLQALDAATGKPAWKVEDAVEGYGSPIAAKIGDTDVVVSPDGFIVRASDGKVLAKDLGRLLYSTPVVQDGVLYFIDITTAAFRLPDKIGDKLEIKKLWETDLEGEFFASGAVAEGFVFAASNQGRLYAVEGKTGKIAWQKDLDIPSAGGGANMPTASIYPSLCLAGRYLFLSNDAGDTLTLVPGKEYKEEKRSKLGEGCGATAAFAGKRAYIRAGDNLYCIGD